MSYWYDMTQDTDFFFFFMENKEEKGCDHFNFGLLVFKSVSNYRFRMQSVINPESVNVI